MIFGFYHRAHPPSLDGYGVTGRTRQKIVLTVGAAGGRACTESIRVWYY
jgi:hypothetical protein